MITPKMLEETKEFYEKNVYGRWRSNEKVSYQIHKISKRLNDPIPENPFAAMMRLSTTDQGVDVEITVIPENSFAKNNSATASESKAASGSFTVRAYLPEENAKKPFSKGCPYIVCMHPIQPQPMEYALSQGYALIFMDTAMVAMDNNLRKGLFYDLYPYTDNPDEQTGELMAWGWAASKVIDAMEAGLAKELGICTENAIVTGVSRWGKATAVCGAFEKRFKMTVPVCSGAGGLALWKYQSEGKTYDLTAHGGPKDYVYGKNEPLDCLQSDAERGWFNDAFLQYKTYADIPVEQYMLPVLAADKNRKYMIIAAWMGEDWVNAPAMWECYLEAQKIIKEMGIEHTLSQAFHKEGHAVLEEDMVEIIKEFNTCI